MLASSKIIGFVPTKDSAKARGFYEGILQFQFVSDDMFALVMKAGETMSDRKQGFHSRPKDLGCSAGKAPVIRGKSSPGFMEARGRI